MSQVSAYLPFLEKTSLLLALRAGLSKIAFRHIRTFAITAPKTLNETEIVHDQIIGLFGRLMASSEMEFIEQRGSIYSQSARISDYQKWACRHLCNNPESWSLIMLVAHCSCFSGRYTFATKEYYFFFFVSFGLSSKSTRSGPAATCATTRSPGA